MMVFLLMLLLDCLFSRNPSFVCLFVCLFLFYLVSFVLFIQEFVHSTNVPCWWCSVPLLVHQELSAD